MTAKLCCVFNLAAHYRADIYRLIDREFDADFYIGDAVANIKTMDYSLLKGYRATLANRNVIGSFYWQSGVLGLLHKSEYGTFLMTGEFFCLSTWLFLLIKALFYRRKRIYFWTHGWYGHEGRTKRILKKMFFGMADGIFLYGNYAREEMVKNGFNGNKLFVIHNSLSYARQLELRKNMKLADIYREHFDNDRPTLIFIGRLTAVKRLDLLIDAVALFKSRNEIYNVVLVGDGVMRRQLEQRAELKGIGHNVWFYGACYDERTNAELIYNADLCVAPGNVGLTAMHTMVFGCPVITHNDFKWQMPEFEAIHPGSTGDFFERDSVESLVDAISRWIAANHSRRDAVRQACYLEIDTQWTPQFQISVIKKGLNI